MEKELRHGQMEQIMKEIKKKKKNKVLEYLNGVMEVYMKVNLMIMHLMVMEHINGMIKDNLQALGKIIK